MGRAVSVTAHFETFVLTTDHWVPHISLVFREMWDKRDYPSSLSSLRVCINSKEKQGAHSSPVWLEWDKKYRASISQTS
jgi:hypothetical protein